MKKTIRNGYTTGSCAQAAAKAAGIMLVSGKKIDSIQIETPRGTVLELGLIDQEVGVDFARCGVIKDSGDEPDVTNGAKIYAEVRFSPKKGIDIKGGKGVGVVTRPGLAVTQGEYAINPIPREMIIKELSSLGRDLEVIISVPDGEELARHTFNPQLGIIGGISIIGTTGIVEPRSLDAYKKSLVLQLDVLKAEGSKRVVLVLGYVGERFCKGFPVIKIGDHVGFMVEECVKRGFEEVFLIGHIGKLVKVAGGQFNTHYSFGDNRIGLMADYARRRRARTEVIKDILRQTTVEAVIPILRENGLGEIFFDISKDVVKNMCKAGPCTCLETRHVQGPALHIVVLSLKGEVLGCYPRNSISLVQDQGQKIT